MIDRRLLFVYGSLKRGFSRHEVLAGQTFLGDAETEPKYALYDFGDYPGMTPGATAIRGEVYEVTADCWPVLDRVECVDGGLYVCEQVALQSPFESHIVYTYLYAQDVGDMHPIGPVWPVESE